jgi:ribosomal-protein-serine acetyltransferase
MLAIPESISAGGRIDLVPVAASHTQRLYEAIVESKGELSPWMEWLHPEYSLADTEQWAASCQKAWEADSMFGFTIVEKQTQQILGGGGVGITSHLHRNGAIGYWIRSSRTKRGFASESAALLAQFGFGQLGLIRIEILVAVGNTASQRVAEKVGAVREGLLRNRWLFRGEPRDAYVFSLVPTGGLGLCPEGTK